MRRPFKSCGRRKMLARDQVRAAFAAVSKPVLQAGRTDEPPLPDGPEDYGLSAACEHEDEPDKPAAPQRRLPLQWLDMASWDTDPVPERQWAIRDRVPLNQAGLFSGEGGTGKSIIELMKNVAHVTATDWLGSMPEPGAAFYLGAGDDEQEIHIRTGGSGKHYGGNVKELIESRRQPLLPSGA